MLAGIQQMHKGTYSLQAQSQVCSCPVWQQGKGIQVKEGWLQVKKKKRHGKSAVAIPCPWVHTVCKVARRQVSQVAKAGRWWSQAVQAWFHPAPRLATQGLLGYVGVQVNPVVGRQEVGKVGNKVWLQAGRQVGARGEGVVQGGRLQAGKQRKLHSMGQVVCSQQWGKSNCPGTGVGMLGGLLYVRWQGCKGSK